MAKLYYRKIKNGDINHMTGEAWSIEDVPVLWKAEVQEMLDGEDGD